MAKSICINIPEDKLTRIKKAMLKNKFKTIDEYILYSVDIEQNMISEDELLEIAKRAKKDYLEGNVYTGLDILRNTIKGTSKK